MLFNACILYKIEKDTKTLRLKEKRPEKEVVLFNEQKS